MPKSFLIKRASRVNTGYFPWSREMLLPGCCLEYEEDSSDAETSEQNSDIDSENDGPCQYLSAIKILTPYHTSSRSLQPRLILTACCDSDVDEQCSVSGEHNDFIFPSPPGTEASPALCDCHTCNKTRHASKLYNTPPTLRRHFLITRHNDGIYEDIEKHQCDHCPKWFNRPSSLSNHKLIHNNTKTFKCNQCHMSFLRKSDLGKHMVTHTGVKPYQCNVCGKRFSQSSNMLTHQRRHTGIRPYSCEVCGKSFFRKVDVRRHMSVHKRR